MTFIFIAGILVRNMDGLSPTRNFLDTQKNRTINRALDVGENEGGHHEIYLLISILCYNSFAAAGVQVLPWTLVSELYPIQVSGSFTALYNWLHFIIFCSTGEGQDGRGHRHRCLCIHVRSSENFPVHAISLRHGDNVLFVCAQQLVVLCLRVLLPARNLWKKFNWYSELFCKAVIEISVARWDGNN